MELERCTGDQLRGGRTVLFVMAGVMVGAFVVALLGLRAELQTGAADVAEVATA